MSYTVLARRHRPQTFDDVVGQEAIARALERAIAQDKTAHAYLFVGTRGVGKTSLARIFAKALNCPDGEPADVATAIMQGRDTDVIEIDAASNRGVDEARDLIASSGIRPLRGGFKVYIIDEVHMLTREAFNALLKTMEEPPGHVKFILCTTEAHKVPATIQSRCQRFDFRNIAADRIADRLRAALAQEGAHAEDEALARVAELAAGSMRDALSILDRLLASLGEGQSITAAHVQAALGLAPDDLLADLIDAFAAENVGEALRLGRELLAQGVDVEQALYALAAALRDVMALAACGEETALVAAAGRRRERAIAQAARLDAPAAAHMIALCDAVALRARTSSVSRELFDVAMIRLAGAARLAQSAALLARSQVESKCADGALPARSGARKKKA